MRQWKACREFKPMPASTRIPGFHGQAGSEQADWTHSTGVAAEGSSGNAEDEGFPAGVNLYSG